MKQSIYVDCFFILVGVEMISIHKILFPTLVISLVLALYSEFFWSIIFYSVTIIGTVISLCLQNRTHYATIMWIYILVFLPVIGYLFYLFSGQLEIKGELFKKKKSDLKKKFIEIQKETKPVDYTFFDDEVYDFIQYANKSSISQVSQCSDVEVLTNGRDTFKHMYESISQAKQFICLEFYIFRTDKIGCSFLEKLLEKKREGVEVYLLIDAIGSWRFSWKWVRKLKENGINIQYFSPLKFAFFNHKLNFRNHRKLAIIDGRIGYIGGLNIGNEYASLDENKGFWRDSHIKVMGEAVFSLYHLFVLDWSYTSGKEINLAWEKERILANNGALQVVASGPDAPRGLMGDYYFQLINTAKKSIWIASPYFIPDEAIRTSLRIQSKKGVEVKLLLPKKNDRFLTQYASQSYFEELLLHGVEIYLYEKGFLHQKVIIIDEMLATIGTANVDMRSFQLNFEANVFLYQHTEIRKLTNDFINDLKCSQKISPSQFYKRSLWIKWKESFARLFSGVL